MMLCGGKPPPANCHILRWRSAQGPIRKAVNTALLRGSSPHHGFHQPGSTNNERWVRPRVLAPGDQPPGPAQRKQRRGADDRDNTWGSSERLQSATRDSSSRGSSRGRGTKYTNSTSTPPPPVQHTGSPRYPDGYTSRREQQSSVANRRPQRSHSAPPAPSRGDGFDPPAAGTGVRLARRRMSSLHPVVKDAIKADLPHVVRQVAAYKQLVEHNAEQGQLLPTLSADIIHLCISLSSSITRDSRDARDRRRLSLQQDSQLQLAAKQEAEWLLAQSGLLVQDSHAQALSTQSTDGCLPMMDLCALAFTLHDFEEVVGNQDDILQLAQATSEHAALRLQLGDVPPSMQAWKDLLYGLTMAGLVVSADRAAEGVGSESIHLQQLLDGGAQHLPAVLRSQAAEARNVSLTFLSYAYAGYTGDLGPVTQALASNMERCLQDAIPQALSNILWALGKLSESWRHGTHPTHVQSIFSWALGKLKSQLQLGQLQRNSQTLSNAVYGCALAGHTEGLPQFLVLVCQHPELMDRAIPQNWSNLVWGVATLCEIAADDRNMPVAGDLQQYGRQLLARCAKTPGVMRNAKPQEWANSVWAAAKLGSGQEGAQLLTQLARNIHIMSEAAPRHLSNSVWAAATMYQAAFDAGDVHLAQQLQHTGHKLLKVCGQKGGPTSGTNLQDCSNNLWAAATLRLYNQGLFEQAVQQLSAAPSALVLPQQFSNALWACAICAHWDSVVQQLLGRVRVSDLAQCNEQDLPNIAWAWAVLACLAQEDGSYERHEHCFQQVAAGLFKLAASRPASNLNKEHFRQLYRAHLFAGHLGIQGLPAGQVLEAAMQESIAADFTTSPWQRGVNSTLRQMGYTTQLEGPSSDSLMTADIVITALPGGSHCSIAVETDGPSHYVAEQTDSRAVVDRLNGPTRLRNALLSRSFPDGLVCIYWKDWAAVEGDQEAQEEYLSKELAKVVQPLPYKDAVAVGASSASTASGSGSPTTSARSVRVRRSPAGGGKSDSKVLGGKAGASVQQQQPSSPAAAHQQAPAQAAGKPGSDHMTQEGSGEGGDDDEAGTGATRKRKAARKTGPGEQSPSVPSSTNSRAAARKRSSKQQVPGQ